MKKKSSKVEQNRSLMIIAVAVGVVIVMLGLVYATQTTNLDNRPKAGFAVRGF